MEPREHAKPSDATLLLTQIFSRPVFTLTLSRSMTSGLIKSVLPIAIITAISLSAFVMSAKDYSQKMALGITTMLSTTAPTSHNSAATHPQDT
jgi:hypothetical protein